ncbi:MAG: 30S ribosomal protein S20 [Candidatus Omnitrophica bacterium]|nr:30S ribosomal protein S20 [Candidatus Omnitrophota bacterium]
MPNRKTSVQDLKKSRARQMHNLDIKTDLRKTTRLFTDALKANPTEAKKALDLLYKKIDKAAKRKIMAKNTASHRKSKFAKLLTASQTK